MGIHIGRIYGTTHRNLMEKVLVEMVTGTNAINSMISLEETLMNVIVVQEGELDVHFGPMVIHLRG
jgi:hypothetical protein